MLRIGPNTAEIPTHAQDNITSFRYAVSVYRLEGIPTLRHLNYSANYSGGYARQASSAGVLPPQGLMVPAFAHSIGYNRDVPTTKHHVQRYTAYMPVGATSVTIVPTLNSPLATVRVNAHLPCAAPQVGSSACSKRLRIYNPHFEHDEVTSSPLPLTRNDATLLLFLWLMPVIAWCQRCCCPLPLLITLPQC